MQKNNLPEKIHIVIENYKKNFTAVDKQERYKWEAIAWYRKHWNIDAPDFAPMLTNAFSKASNLLASGMYYPYRMITEYANANPEEVRRIFKLLHDESLPLEERYQAFRASCKARIDEIMKGQPNREKALNHYQDIRAVMVYLTFQYPEKYYLFKSRMYSEFCKRVGFQEEKNKRSSALWKVESFLRLCEIVREEAMQDEELLSMHRARLDEDCYRDEAYHLLAMDLIYYGSNYLSAEDFEIETNQQLSPAAKPKAEEEATTDIGLNIPTRFVTVRSFLCATFSPVPSRKSKT